MTYSLSPATPPAVAERLLRLSVRDPDWRDAVLGDLREEYAGMLQKRGPRGAQRWYWRQSLPLAARFALSRVLPAAAPPRRRGTVTVASIEAASLGTGWQQEFRHAWRALWQRPGLSAVIVITLALALTANAVIFNLADALYLRPFRFAQVDRLILVASDTGGDKPYFDRESVTPADFLDWTRTVTTARELTALAWWDPNYSGVDRPEQVHGFHVSPGFFDLMRVQPVLGRAFTPDEGRLEANHTVVLSHAFWLRRFNADPAVVGRTLRLDGVPHEVVGVMPPRFAVPYGAEVWAPLAYDDAAWADRRRGNLMVFGRLADGQTLDTARAEIAGVVARQAAEFPDTNRDRKSNVVSFSRGLGDDAVGPFVAIWQAAAGLLLLIACANIANLLLARGTERQPEFAIRLALGAGRGRLFLQLLIEGLCLAALGIAVGFVLAAVAIDYSRHFLPATVVRFVPGYEFIRLDLATMTAMAAIGALATVVFSLVPALQASRAAAGGAMLSGTRASTAPPGRQWLRSLLAGAQVALTLALMVAAALIVGAVNRAANGAMGFDKRNLITAHMTLPTGPYADQQRRRAFADTLLERVRGVPSVTEVAVISALPYASLAPSRTVYLDGQPMDDAVPRTVDLQRATPGYFAALRIPLVAGRGLSDGDGPDAPRVAVVSQRLAEDYWPGQDPLGQRLRLDKDGEWLVVVGVVGDVLQDWFTGRRLPTVYRPLAQDATLSMTFVARTEGNPTLVADAVRRAVSAADADQPIENLATMEQVITAKVTGINYFAKVISVMSGVALLLAVMGMYSLMSYLSSRRTREIGLRVALGATRPQVMWLTASRAGRITAGGVVAGLLLAAMLGRVMQSALFGLVAPDPWVLSAAVLALAVVTLAAGFLPARKAARQDPWQALRAD
jgi:putative ABC transport system permease protein